MVASNERQSFASAGIIIALLFFTAYARAEDKVKAQPARTNSFFMGSLSAGLEELKPYAGPPDEKAALPAKDYERVVNEFVKWMRFALKAEYVPDEAFTLANILMVPAKNTNGKEDLAFLSYEIGSKTFRVVQTGGHRTAARIWVFVHDPASDGVRNADDAAVRYGKFLGAYIPTKCRDLIPAFSFSKTAEVYVGVVSPSAPKRPNPAECFIGATDSCLAIPKEDPDMGAPMQEPELNEWFSWGHEYDLSAKKKQTPAQQDSPNSDPKKPANRPSPFQFEQPLPKADAGAVEVKPAAVQNAGPPDAAMATPESLRAELEAAAKEPIAFTANGTWNVLPALVTIIRQFEVGRRSPQVIFTPFDSDQIVGRLCRHECDVGMPFDSFVPDDNREAASKLQSVTLGRFVVAVAVNANSSVRSLTMEQVCRTFTWNPLTRGITSWKEVAGSGSTAEIELLRPATLCPASLVFRKKLQAEQPFTDIDYAGADHSPGEKSTDAAVIEALAKQPNAIGYFFYRCDQRTDKRIRILAIAKDNESPAVPLSPTTVADGAYPLSDMLRLYVHPKAPAAASDFCKFATGAECAKILKQFGLWPELELNAVRGRARLAEVKAGKGAALSVAGGRGYESLVHDLSLKYVEAEEAVRLRYHAEPNKDAVRAFLDGKTELLLLDGVPFEELAGALGRPAVEITAAPRRFVLGHV
ncbi:MAG TPA: substrate-binding domain-containing protein, partial [Tepidisphaeraceae bacterium]|nr:substrate-binding domain-containing protein [Tepidisphaeraceae bacterium]